MGNAGQTPQYASMGEYDERRGQAASWFYPQSYYSDFGPPAYREGGYGGTLANPRGYYPSSHAYSAHDQASMRAQLADNCLEDSA
jgi:hypothetical protein